MKILHLSSEKSWRGGEQQIAYLIHELNGQGVEHVIACRSGSAFEAYCRKAGWNYYSLPFKGSMDISTILGIKKISKREKADLIHIHSAKSHSLAVMSHMIGNRTPLILSRRVDFPVRNNFLTQWKYNHTAIKKIICVSEAIEQIVRAGIQHPERCVTVHSGIDLNRFRKSSGYLRKTYQIPENVWLIGNTSALASHKDYYTFINTADIFRQYDIPAHFLIIGDGPEKDNIYQYIAEKGLRGYITMTGFLNNIPEVLPELDIFFMPSVTEGLGTSILDAFACKVPVVVTRAGGIPEMVIHEKTGLLAEIKDASTLALHLKKIIKNPVFRNEMVENAYQHLLNHFTKEKMASDTFGVYREVIESV